MSEKSPSRKVVTEADKPRTTTSLLRRFIGSRVVQGGNNLLAPEQADTVTVGLRGMAIKNAKAAGKDLIARSLEQPSLLSLLSPKEFSEHGDYLARLVQEISDLDNEFGYDLNNPSSNIRAGRYGFSRERPKTIFKWNLDDRSNQFASDILLLLGASKLAEPQLISMTKTPRMERIEYDSVSGLSFIDVKEFFGKHASTDYHSLLVYLDVAKQTAETIGLDDTGIGNLDQNYTA